MKRSSIGRARISETATSQPSGKEGRPTASLVNIASAPMKKACIETLHKAAMQDQISSRVSTLSTHPNYHAVCWTAAS